MKEFVASKLSDVEEVSECCVFGVRLSSMSSLALCCVEVTFIPTRPLASAMPKEEVENVTGARSDVKEVWLRSP